MAVRIEQFKQELQDEWEVTGMNGFLPKRDPLSKLPEQFQDVECICANLETLIPNLKVGYYVENHLADHMMEIQSIQDDVPLITALFRDYAFLTSAYLLEHCQSAYRITREYPQAKEVLPAKIALPIQYLSQLLGGKPWIDYHRSYVLYNYQKINPDGPVHYDNIKTIRHFTSNPGESGFILTHTSIAGHSPKIVGHIENIFSQIVRNERSKINEELNSLCVQFGSIKDEMKQMYTRNSIESYFEFRTFLSGTMGTPMFKKGVIYEGHNDQPEFVRGPSGALDLTMPTIDRFIGLSELFPENALTQLLAEYKQHIPVHHQQYIKRVENMVKRLQLIDYIMKDSKTLLCFMKCLYNVVLFRQTHYNFVKEYIIKREKVAIGTGGSDATSFVSNQLIVLYDYFISLCDKAGSCSTQNSRDLKEMASLKINVTEKKELFLATLEALKKSLSNDYDSILKSNLSGTYESAMNLQKNDKLFYLKDQFYLPQKDLYFASEKNEILSKKVESALNSFLQIWKSNNNNQSNSSTPNNFNQHSQIFGNSKLTENQAMSPCIYATMAMQSQQNSPSTANSSSSSLAKPEQNSSTAQGCLKTQLSNITEKLSHMISCYEQEIGLTPTIQIAIYQILSAFLKAQLATKEKILIIQNSSNPSSIVKHVKQWLERYYPEMKESEVIEVFTIQDSDTLTQSQIQETVMKQIEEHQYNTALMIMSFNVSLQDKYINIKEVASACNKFNIYFVLDTISSFGITPLKLHDSNVDASFFQPSHLYPIGGIFIHQKHTKNDQFFSSWLGKKPLEKKILKHCASAESLDTYSENSDDLDSDNGDDEDFIFDNECRSLHRFDVSRFEKLQIIQLNAQYDYIIEAGVLNISKKIKDMMDYLSYLFSDIQGIKYDKFLSNYTNIFSFKIDKKSASINTKKLHEFLRDNKIVSEYSKKTGYIRIHLNSFYNHFMDCHELFNITKGIISEYL